MNDITHIQIKTIIPLEYERETFLKNLNEKNGVFSKQSILQEVNLESSMYNELGKKLFINNDKSVYIARIKNTADAGLYQDRGVTYITNTRINTTDKLPFKMGDIYIFFHCFRAYLILTANIPVAQWIENGADAADLYSQCRDFFTKNLSRRGEKRFSYRDKSGTQEYSYKAVAESICGRIDIIGEVKPDLEHIYSQINVLLKMIPEDGNKINNLMQDFIFYDHASGSMHNPTNRYLNGNWQITDHKNKKINKLFWGYGDKQFVVIPNEECSFTNGPSSGLYKSITKNYMALYTLWIDSREKLLLERGNNREAWKNVRALLASVLMSDRFKHINDIFINLANAIAETPQDIAVPLKDMAKEDDYIFVSYSHKDFVKVYCDLYHFKDKNLPFWYDRGLYENADEEWHRHVKSRLESPNCKGVLFYLSEDFLLSKSVEKEVKTVLSKGKPYFVVGLPDNPIPGAVLKRSLAKASLSQVQDNGFMELIQTMASAFPNTKTILNPHDDEYYHQIAQNFEKCLLGKGTKRVL